MTATLEPTTDQPLEKKRKKQKKRKEDQTSDQASDQAENPKKRRKCEHDDGAKDVDYQLQENLKDDKKRPKGKEKAAVAKDAESLPVADVMDVGVGRQEKKKKGKRNAQDDESGVVETARSEERKRKKRKEGVYDVDDGESHKAESVDMKSQGEKQEKKGKKKKRSKTVVESEEVLVKVDDEVDPPKKKRKNKTGLLDPEDDDALVDQARKALAYAFMQFRHPSRWKFNKARQNWLIRNFWSTTVIPERHLPLVLKYLSVVQGGVRENLIQSCHKILTSSTNINTTSLDTAPTSILKNAPTILPPKVDNSKQERAKLLLEVLGVSAEIQSLTV